jgi:hypothetical protein
LPDVADFLFTRTIPILRIFSVAKAKEFYCEFLGFTIDWEYRFDDGSPLYMQVSRAGLVLHLSEHHGDGCPGAVVHIEMTGIDIAAIRMLSGSRIHNPVSRWSFLV